MGTRDVEDILTVKNNNQQSNKGKTKVRILFCFLVTDQTRRTEYYAGYA